MEHEKTISEKCTICGEESFYDKETLSTSRHIINGNRHTICCPCEDSLRLQLSKRRGDEND